MEVFLGCFGELFVVCDLQGLREDVQEVVALLAI
jgi:hypothetical protein